MTRRCWRRLRAAKYDPWFYALFDRGELGIFGDDRSRADLALCLILAFWCGSDTLRIDRLFRRFALYIVRSGTSGTLVAARRTVR